LEKTEIGVIGFAFGVDCNIISNVYVGKTATDKGVPIFTQKDLFIENPTSTVDYIEEKEDPPPTLRIAREAVKWAMKLGIKELWVAAARPHLWRCVRDLKYAIKEAGVQIQVRVCDEIGMYPKKEWFCSNSTQKRTRSPKDWWPREIILRLMPMFIYKRIAG